MNCRRNVFFAVLLWLVCVACNNNGTTIVNNPSEGSQFVSDGITIGALTDDGASEIFVPLELIGEESDLVNTVITVTIESLEQNITISADVRALSGGSSTGTDTDATTIAAAENYNAENEGVEFTLTGLSAGDQLNFTISQAVVGVGDGPESDIADPRIFSGTVSDTENSLAIEE